MAWEILAIWIIVAATVVWFVRDERQKRLSGLMEKARGFATDPAFRHREPEPALVPVIARTAAPPKPLAADDLTPMERRFLESLRPQN
jgi:hypothetical protein